MSWFSEFKNYISVIIRFLFLFCLVSISGCKENLYSGLSEQESNEMMAILIGNNIQVDRIVTKEEKNVLRVDKSDIPRAVTLLKKSGYPKPKFRNMGDVFQGNGFILSPTEERARFIYAMSEELSQTISNIDGVLTARIHVVLPKNNPIKRNSTPSSASVFIRHAADADMTGLLTKIKMLVASSIEGLTYDHVSVVMTRAEPIQEIKPQTASQAGMQPFNVFSMRTYVEVAFILIALSVLVFIFFRRKWGRAKSDVQSIQSFDEGPRLRRVS